MTKLIYLLIVFMFQCGNDDGKTRATPHESNKQNEHSPSTLKLDGLNALQYSDSLFNGDISIVLNKIVDGRCPKGVVCVWEGNAKAHLTVLIAGDYYNIELNTHRKYDQDTILQNKLFKLVNVTPYPEKDQQQEDKTAVISISPVINE